jgi:hypothetical protein
MSGARQAPGAAGKSKRQASQRGKSIIKTSEASKDTTVNTTVYHGSWGKHLETLEAKQEQQEHHSIHGHSSHAVHIKASEARNKDTNVGTP